MSPQKADLQYNLSVYSKATSYNIFTLTDKKIQANALLSAASQKLNGSIAT